MTASDWIALGSLAIAAVAIIWRGGLDRGRTTAILEQLTKITVDHETRLREQERISQLYVAQVPAERPRQQRRPRG